MGTSDSIIIRNFTSPFGEMILGSFGEMLCLCDWKYRKMRKEVDTRVRLHLDSEFLAGDSPVINNTIDQLSEYFEGRRESFDIPLLLAGSEFQKQVWEKIREIPYGETRSYAELTRTLGNEGAIRAVASANGANATAIIIPCHRVIGSNGELTGYAGGLEAKKRLLKLEAKGKGVEQLELF